MILIKQGRMKMEVDGNVKAQNVLIDSHNQPENLNAASVQESNQLPTMQLSGKITELVKEKNIYICFYNYSQEYQKAKMVSIL